ncbi:MAG: xylulokinase [Oscillospiraceae bacterium]
MTATEKIRNGQTRLGIELGSTRIKAVLTDDTFTPIASGSFDWENRFENGCWTYSLDDIHNGIRGCYASLAADVESRYGTELEHIGAMGVSAMMHGYMAFDRSGQLLVPFRTWRNTMTSRAAAELTALLGFNIPQRWSCAHLYQAVLNGEEHTKNIHHINTLAGYIHELLTGVRAVGTGEASGIFPVSGESYDKDMLKKYSATLASHGFTADISEVFPKAVTAGTPCGALTTEGAAFLDPTGKLKAGVPFCPPEGDAGTGMAASNAVRPQTGNISAGTSIFAMLVLDKPLKGVYPEIDAVTTPDGAPVAMVHCNNCCSEIDVWVKIIGEFAELTGHPMDKSALYETLYRNALNGSPDCGGVTAYNYLSGEPVTGVESGRPMYFRTPDSKMSLANFFRAQLYSTMAALKHGMDILFKNESAAAAQFTGHGGLFKVKGAAQQLMADALKSPVAVMTTAGEGGAWGMSLLASYMLDGGGKSLADWLDEKVFADMERYVLTPDKDGSEGFDKFMERYISGLAAERIFGKD